MSFVSGQKLGVRIEPHEEGKEMNDSEEVVDKFAIMGGNSPMTRCAD